MIRIAILTLSDKGASGLRRDESGPVLRRMVEGLGEVVRMEILPDDREAIARRLAEYADTGIDLVLTTGGTGLSPRDVTPEATLDVADRQVPGMAEAMRAAGLAKTPHAMLSRAVAAVRGRTLILNLPGSPRGARENLEAVLPALGHAIGKIGGDPTDCGGDAGG